MSVDMKREERALPAMCMETVADVMVRHPKLGREDSTVGDVRQFFADDHVHAVLIMSATRLLTVIDYADLGAETADSLPAARLGGLSGRVIAPTAPADAARQLMIAASRRRLAVVGQDGTLLGLLCLKRSGTGFCSDETLRQRQREHLQAEGSGPYRSRRNEEITPAGSMSGLTRPDRRSTQMRQPGLAQHPEPAEPLQVALTHHGHRVGHVECQHLE
jgi:hypothetical protein